MRLQGVGSITAIFLTYPKERANWTFPCRLPASAQPTAFSIGSKAMASRCSCCMGPWCRAPCSIRSSLCSKNGSACSFPICAVTAGAGISAGPYDVPALAADLDVVLAESGFEHCAVMGYSHGGAVAQQLAHTRPAAVSRLILACTYACNAATLKERPEGEVFTALLHVFSPAAWPS